MTNLKTIKEVFEDVLLKYNDAGQEEAWEALHLFERNLVKAVEGHIKNLDEQMKMQISIDTKDSKNYAGHMLSIKHWIQDFYRIKKEEKK